MWRKLLEAVFGHFLKQSSPVPLTSEENEQGTHLPLEWRVWAQRKLRELGLNTATKDYELLPPAVVSAVKAYQRIKGLYVDGIIGPQTWNSLTEQPEGKLTIDPAPEPVQGLPWFNVAQKLIGLSEIAGGEHNPLILKMFAASGHSWVKDDETSWCAAFVGYCLDKAGLKGTGELNARSYLDWGNKVDKIEKGAVAVFWRESPDSWKGHVAFCTGRVKPGYIEVLGGNQSNSVNKAWYPTDRLLGLRMPI